MKTLQQITEEHLAIAQPPDFVLKCAVEIVSAFVRNNPIPVSEIETFLQTTFFTLRGLTNGSIATSGEKLEPAVPIKKSIMPDYIICLEDGKKLKMLKRYLRTHFDLTPEEYRSKWGLPFDYPVVAPNYAAARSAFAKEWGLGKKNRQPKVKAKKK